MQHLECESVRRNGSASEMTWARSGLKPTADGAPGGGGSFRSLALILLAGLAVRLVLWWGVGDRPLTVWDERDYRILALGILERGEFGFIPGIPTALRPPLYPAFLAGTYAFFGADNHQAVRLLQVLLSVATIGILYALGSVVYSPRVGLWAAGLLAFYPSLLAYNHLLLTETTFTFLLCATCLALAVAVRRGGLTALALAGVLLGLATLTRSVLWLFPPVLAAYLLWAWPGRLGRRMLAAAVATLAFAATVAPWSIRNTLLNDTFVAIDTMGGRNFMMGNYEYTPELRAWDAISVEGSRSWIAVLASKHDSLVGLTQGQLDKLALKAGLEYALENPGTTARRDLIKFIQFWGLEREVIAGVARGQSGEAPSYAVWPLALVILLAYVGVMVAGIMGLVLVPPGDRRHQVLLLLVVGFICAMHVATFGHSRYHLPLMPIVLTYAAAALTHLPAIWRRRRSWAFALACLLVGVFAAGWTWEVGIAERARWLPLWEHVAGLPRTTTQVSEES